MLLTICFHPLLKLLVLQGTDLRFSPVRKHLLIRRGCDVAKELLQAGWEPSASKTTAKTLLFAEWLLLSGQIREHSSCSAARSDRSSLFLDPGTRGQENSAENWQLLLCLYIFLRRKTAWGFPKLVCVELGYAAGRSGHVTSGSCRVARVEHAVRTQVLRALRSGELKRWGRRSLGNISKRDFACGHGTR